MIVHRLPLLTLYCRVKDSSSSPPSSENSHRTSAVVDAVLTDRIRGDLGLAERSQ